MPSTNKQSQSNSNIDNHPRQALINWFSANNIEYDSTLLQIEENRITAKSDIPVDTIVATIPKQSILSIRTTAVADIIEQEQLGGTIALIVAVLYELSDSNSPWREYLDSLPDTSNLPIFWSQEELLELKGTDLFNELTRLKEDVRNDYEELIVPLFERHPDQFKQDFMTFDLFFKTAAWCTSRAFEVDAYHQTALVPFADLFNHSSFEHVHFTSDCEVCEFCGALENCCDCLENENAGEWEDEPSERDEENEPPLLENVSQIRSEEDEAEKSMTNDQNLELITVAPISKASEVFNTYGQLSNTSLLSRYGFVEMGNPHSFVSVSREEILRNLTKEFEGERIEFWDMVGNEIVHEIEESFRNKEKDSGEVVEDDADHEHNGVCCGKHGNSLHGDEEEELESNGEFGTEEGDEEEDLEDGFELTKSGPNFALRSFLALLFLPKSAFEQIALDLQTAIPFLMDLAKSQWTPSDSERSLIKSIATERLNSYPTTLKQDTLLKIGGEGNLERKKAAVLLRIEEKELLKSFL